MKCFWILGKQGPSEKYDLGRGHTDKPCWVSITIKFVNKVDFMKTYRKISQPWYLISLAMNGKLFYVYTELSYTISPEIKLAPIESTSLNHKFLGTGAVLEVTLSNKFAKNYAQVMKFSLLCFSLMLPDIPTSIRQIKGTKGSWLPFQAKGVL